MDFDALIKYYSSDGVPLENKQRINLSHRAYGILLNDMAAFQLTHATKKDSLEVSSKLVNRVFCRFCRSARSSISLRLKQERADLNDLLSEVTPEIVRENTIRLLLERYKAQLVVEMKNRMEKGHPLSVRLDGETIDYLASIDGQDEGVYYKNRVGSYIKAVLEEYAEFPYVEREKIYYIDEVNTIEQAATMQRMLNITLHSKPTKGSDKSTHNRLYMKPVGIRQDSEQLYQYVVGIMSPQREGPWMPGAVRLSSIKSCKVLEATAFISQDTKNKIEQQIQQNGVQFLSSHESTTKVVVEFTPHGEKLYRRMLHLRPLYTTYSDKTHVYEFDCNLFHAEAYFFKFGSDAKILAPQNLADLFHQKYKAAVQRYNPDNGV